MRVSDIQALVLAAGKGTRMKSERAKVLHEALGLPLLEHVLRVVRSAGAQPVTVVVGHQAETVKKLFEPAGVDFALQEPQLGTGHAVQVARTQISRHPDRPVLVIHGDVPLVRLSALNALIDSHVKGNAAATLLCCETAEPAHYGRVVRDSRGNVRAVVEFRDATAAERAIREINAGIYLFDVRALCSVLDRLVSANAQGEFYLTDAIGLLAQGGSTVRACVAAAIEDVLGVNTLAELAAAADILRQRRLEALLASGVVIEDPATTWIGVDVQIEADAVVRANTIIEGRSFVRRQASVGPFVRIVNCEIGEQAQILDHCLLRDSSVGARAAVGPFAHIRPESVVGERAKVGNFVELKKTSLGTGAKAPHLSYLGDAQIGPAVNVGAGTITCNYDGVRKHPTRIEQGAFVGSNSTIVAPLTVGAGAYIAAGSTITKDVPRDALALGRAHQVIKEDWAKRRREGS